MLFSLPHLSPVLPPPDVLQLEKFRNGCLGPTPLSFLFAN